MRKLLAAAAALSLASAPAAAQPPQAAEPQQQEEESNEGDMKGELWGYLALPALIVLVLLIAVLAGEEEQASP